MDMKIQNLLSKSETYIPADCREISYNGRIDFSNPKIPIFIYPASYALAFFTGREIGVVIKNNNDYFNNYLGYIVDGVQKKAILSNDGNVQKIILADDLESSKKHNVVIFKRQDTCHEFEFYGFVISNDGSLDIPKKKHRRQMEFYGDFITCGDMSETDCSFNRTDSDYDGSYSNVWYSYSMITARILNAEADIIAQNEASLMGGTCDRDYGIKNMYDKLQYNKNLGDIKEWNFENYRPHVVVVAIGQNDFEHYDFMKTDPYGEKAMVWKNCYRDFILNLRSVYPNALIVLATSILNHNSSWDRAIGSICTDIHEAKIVHFLYSSNGRGGMAIGKPQAEGMAFELSMFIKGFGNSIWHE